MRLRRPTNRANTNREGRSRKALCELLRLKTHQRTDITFRMDCFTELLVQLSKLELFSRGKEKGGAPVNTDSNSWFNSWVQEHSPVLGFSVGHLLSQFCVKITCECFPCPKVLPALAVLPCSQHDPLPPFNGLFTASHAVYNSHSSSSALRISKNIVIFHLLQHFLLVYFLLVDVKALCEEL